MTRRGASTDLNSALGRLVRRLDRSSHGGYRNVRVSELWPEVVGPTIAAHTGRTFLRGDELVVYVDSPIWASELSAMSELLRSRLNEALGKPDVRSLRFAVSREVSDQRRRVETEERRVQEEAEKTPTVTLTERELEEVRESVSAIENEALREAAFRATVKHLEWSRGTEASKTP